MEETAFPRGTGNSTNNSKKRRSSRHESISDSISTLKTVKKSKKEDNLFGNDSTKKRRKKSSSSSNTTGSTEKGIVSSLPQGIQPGGGAVLPASLHPKRDALIENLSFAKLDKGTKLLGIVRADGVNEEYCIISLPNMLTGFVRRGVGGGNDNTPLSDVLSPLQILSVMVKSTSVDTQSKRKIELSIRPRDINAGISPEQLFLPGLLIRGEIISIEDHGCIVDVGMGSSVTAFLKFENVHGYNSETDLNSGRCFDFRVEKPKMLSVLSSSSSKKDKKRRREMESTTTSHILIQLILSSKNGGDGLTKQYAKPSAPSALVGGGRSSGKNTVKTTYTMKSLIPGMLVECQVEEYAKNGLLVTFLDSVFRGAIDENHLGFLNPESSNASMKQIGEGWRDIWKEEAYVSEVTARIIAVDPISKILRLSLLPHLLSLKSPSKPLFQVGEIIRETSLVRVDGSVGALLAIESKLNIDDDYEGNKDSLLPHPLNRLRSKYGSAISRVGIYVNASKAADNADISETELYKLFKKQHSTQAPVRILTASHCLIENFCTASTAPEIISAHVLSHADLKPGETYRKAKILSYQDYGVIISLGQNVRALCQSIHLSDTANSSGTSSDYQKKAYRIKFEPGKTIDVKCLSVNAESKQAYMTHKKTLLNDKLSPLVRHSQIAKNQIYLGYITKIDPSKGIVIAFYNNIYGYCTAQRLTKEMGVEELSEAYRVGNVVKCRIVQLNKHNNKLELSLDTTSEAIEKDEKELQEIQQTDILNVGMCLPSNSVKVIQMVNSSKDERKNKVIKGHALVVVKLKYLATDDKKLKGEIECRIPYEQLEDSYQQNVTEDLHLILDKVAKQTLSVGKSIGRNAVVLVSSHKTSDDIPILSLRPSFLALSRKKKDTNEKRKRNIIPSTPSDLYIGAKVTGFVTNIDQRFGAFVRFANNLTGLIPKLKKGLEEKILNTVNCRVIGLDTNASPPRIILRKSKKYGSIDEIEEIQLNKGDVVGDVVVEEVNFYRASITLMDKKYKHEKRRRSLRARIHVTMVDGNKIKLDDSNDDDEGPYVKSKRKITKYHPFYKWKKGLIVRDAICVSCEKNNGIIRVELTNRVNSNLDKNGESKNNNYLPFIVNRIGELALHQNIACIVIRVFKNYGIRVQVCPGLSAYIPALELSNDIEVLDDLASHYHIGQSIACTVIKKVQPFYRKPNKQKQEKRYQLSMLANISKPKPEDIIIARINRGIPCINSPALMLDCRHGQVARCCITELAEINEWTNMPLGKLLENEKKEESDKESKVIVTDEEKDKDEKEDEKEEETDEIAMNENFGQTEFCSGRHVKCKVLHTNTSVIEVSLQERRIKGNIEDDAPPKLKDIVPAYVITTNKKGCYVRLSRNTVGRVILKELSDSFIPDPIGTFPQGRLVQGKVKQVRKEKGETKVDLDMRESTVLESQDTLMFEELKEGAKYKGIVTRIERYGVFIRLENSQVSGLAHISECSDKFIKGGVHEHYDPGDLVKAYVLKVDHERKKVDFSLKASYFEGDIDSDEDSSDSSDEESTGENGEELDDAFSSDSDDGNSLDSDDDNFASKLASTMKKKDDKKNSDDDAGEDDEEDSSDDDSSSDEEDGEADVKGMDTDIGFDWGMNEGSKSSDLEKDGSSSSSDSDESSVSDGDDKPSSKSKKKTRKKAALKRREEKEIALRESALADGTLDENPETRADFERLIASNPNFSEHWIKFMAYYLSLGDVDSARNVANRAFNRIEFRQEGEKLNVWTALLTLELKYGSPTSLQKTVERACQHNNPKQVYLRVCEMLERIVLDSLKSRTGFDKSKLESEAVKNADDMFSKMCKKFKSKKTVWIAHLKYLLKSARFQEAHELLKRSLKSLPTYKHIETMTKFAQMEYEFGSPERGRTIFDGLLEKYPKRLDLLFVYVDKEVKNGEIEAARSIFKRITEPIQPSKSKFSDKQMKSLFKKWYRIEESNGNEDTQEEVKAAAKRYVEKSSGGTN